MTNHEFVERRLALGYTQTELADIMGKSRASVSRWESGILPLPQLAVLCIEGLPAKGKEEA